MPWIDDFVDESYLSARYNLHHADNPLLVLRAVCDLQRWAADLERLAVEAARQEGEPWSAIAEALRRSRQSVHRQYAHDEPDAS